MYLKYINYICIPEKPQQGGGYKHPSLQRQRDVNFIRHSFYTTLFKKRVSTACTAL